MLTRFSCSGAVLLLGTHRDRTNSDQAGVIPEHDFPLVVAPGPPGARRQPPRQHHPSYTGSEQQQRQPSLSKFTRQLPKEHSRRPLARIVDQLIDDIAGSDPVSKLLERFGKLLAGLCGFSFKLLGLVRHGHSSVEISRPRHPAETARSFWSG